MRLQHIQHILKSCAVKNHANKTQVTWVKLPMTSLSTKIRNRVYRIVSIRSTVLAENCFEYKVRINEQKRKLLIRNILDDRMI